MWPRSILHVALWLGSLSSVGLVASVLALTDIYHGEQDVVLEWATLRVAFLLSVAFHIASIVALNRIAKSGVPPVSEV